MSVSMLRRLSPISLFICLMLLMSPLDVFTQNPGPGWRPDISSFSSTDQFKLAQKIGDWLTTDITVEHVVDGETGVHSTQNFLQWHRTRIRQLENYLMNNNGSEFVPLPKWVPSQLDGTINPIPHYYSGYAIPIPPANVGSQYPEYFDPDYVNDVLDINTNLFDENFLIHPAFVDFDLLYQGDICTFMEGNINQMMDAGRFSDHLETGYHAEGHGEVAFQPNSIDKENPFGVRSAFGDLRSSNYLLFWLYHAWIDEIWYWWEAECDANYTKVNPSPYTGFQAWFGNDIVKGTVTIEAGGTLVILGHAQFQDAEYSAHDTKIIVKNGGKLILDGGTLSGINILGNFGDSGGTGVAYKTPWDGILLEDGGEVEIINGGSIEDARIGINNPGGGGKITATGATFKNNRSDVILGTIGLGSAWNENNLSSFTNCSFLFDAPLRDYMWESNTIGADAHRYYVYDTQKKPYPDKHVELHNVGGITFSGCTFNNASNVPLVNQDYVSTGIFAFGSEFTCNQQTSFSGLLQGISAWTYFAANPISHTYVDNCTFTDNLIGIRLGSSEFAEVLNSTFNIPKEVPAFLNNPYLLHPVGIHSGGGAGIMFIGNAFSTIGNPVDPQNIGIYARRTCQNAPNWIADNSFGGVRLGVQTVDNNSELQISCNNFAGFANLNRRAIAATSGVLADQGDCFVLPAGNSWDHASCGGTPSQLYKNNQNLPGLVPDYDYNAHSNLLPDPTCISSGISANNCGFPSNQPGQSCEDVFDIFDPRNEIEREQYINALNVIINNTTDPGALTALKRMRLSEVYYGTRDHLESGAISNAYNFLSLKGQQGIDIYPGDLAALAVATGNHTAATSHLNLMNNNDPNKALIQFIQTIKQSGRDLHQLTALEKEWLENAASSMDQCSSQFPQFPANGWNEPPIEIEAISFAGETVEERDNDDVLDVNADQALSIFPNPTKGILNIEWLGEKNANAQLYSTTGHEVWSGTLLSGQINHLNLSHLSSGVYILAIQNKDTFIWQKVILSH